MLQTHAFDVETAAMLRQLYDKVCAQFVSLAPDEPRMREVIATAIVGIATNGQRKPDRILRYARFKAAELLSTLCIGAGDRPRYTAQHHHSRAARQLPGSPENPTNTGFNS